MELAQLVAEKTSGPLIAKVLGDPTFRSADTDARFSKLFGALASRKIARRSAAASAWQDPKGRPVVRIQRAKEKTVFSFNEKLAPEFGAFVLGKLDELYTTFSSARARDASG